MPRKRAPQMLAPMDASTDAPGLPQIPATRAQTPVTPIVRLTLQGRPRRVQIVPGQQRDRTPRTKPVQIAPTVRPTRHRRILLRMPPRPIARRQLTPTHRAAHLPTALITAQEPPTGHRHTRVLRSRRSKPIDRPGPSRLTPAGPPSAQRERKSLQRRITTDRQNNTARLEQRASRRLKIIRHTDGLNRRYQ